MPRWTFLSKPFTAWQRRVRSNVQISEFLNGILPTVQLDKHWTDDRLDVWGLYTQSQGDGVHVQACSLVAQEREALVHKVEIWWDSAGNADYSGIAVHMFTPLQTYDPCDTGRSIYYPWVQTGYRAGMPGYLGRCFGQAGHGSGLQVVLVNGAPVTTIGPTYAMPRVLQVGLGGTGLATVPRKPVVLWSMQDPPLRIKPWSQLCVQAVAVTTSGQLLNVQFYYSERDPQGDVG